MTAYLVSNMIKNQFDWFTMKPCGNKKTLTKQIIFLACFIFEDIGQVLLQEKLHFVKTNPKIYLPSHRNFDLEAGKSTLTMNSS